METDSTWRSKERPERVFLKASNGADWRQSSKVNSDIHKLSMLLDCGRPSTIVGVEDFKIIKEQYPVMIQDSFEYKESNKNYQFGGGSKTFSMGRVRLPIYVVDSSHIPHHSTSMCGSHFEVFTLNTGSRALHLVEELLDAISASMSYV